MSDIEQRVKKIVAEQLGANEADVKLESSFVDDLGADSLDTVELVMALEEAFECEITDEEALIDALERGAIAGAGLDVFAHEPAVDPRLLALGNVMLLPHMGSATHEGRLATGDKVIANIRTWVDGHRPRDQVLEGLV